MDRREEDRHRQILATHIPHSLQWSAFGTQNCRECGERGRSISVGDGPATIYGCPDWLDSKLALHDAGILLQQVVPPKRPVAQ